MLVCRGGCLCRGWWMPELPFPMAPQLQVVLSCQNCHQAFCKRSNTLNHCPSSSDPIPVFLSMIQNTQQCPWGTMRFGRLRCALTWS